MTKKIITDCQRGKPVAQKQLYEQYLPYVVGICRRFNIQSAELKDTIQEIFIETFLNINKYNPNKGEFKYWLKSIAIHKILNQFRKKRIQFTDLAELPNDAIPRTQIKLEDLNAKYLLHLIAELPTGYRTVFNLYVIDGYSHKEIGELLDISTSASRSQLTRAKQLLQTKITQLRQYEP